ncbi:preprotein translocase subunit SecA [Phreatobacter oligotrophus]|uniref:preprotein translocase subunit SecA n=1 Tax=Phreatobacter oligotrophus TaxID=1122261 RepID=UPI0023536E28|nr:preprotein translocase subunit SecA [Phreatobacter oligotrophus]MBX9990190.1 preprotein translocase subunit SecA [Phreatobacter oligotrophus]
MLAALARRIFGNGNDRRVKGYRPRIQAIAALEPELEKLSDEALRARTDEFRAQLAAGKSLDDLLVPAFATVREAAKRVLGQRHYDVQMIGGIVLHEGAIAEMKTGEGKTLVATLAVYLNALAGKGVHVVTVNDYLAKRDAEWMGKVYGFLGMTTGVIVHGLDDQQRREAYACDITYGTNNEYGFDYLRDNMKYSVEEMVQRGHAYAIVDEVDSILIDEARTPLIISGPLDDRSDFYATIDRFIPMLDKGDYEVDEKQRTAALTETGNEKMERALVEAGYVKGDLYDVENVSTVHHVNQALKAHKLFQRDKDYIVRNGEVVIIDEFTGRMMPGRRYSEGLHQALEAKERVQVQPENQTLASITFQNYFRMYGKLGGMTGTALTEADEFLDIYKLQVVEIPTNRGIARIDEDDEVYKTVQDKYNAIIVEVEAARAKGQPVLVGTTSIEKSETLAEMLKAAGFKQVDLEDPQAFAPLYDGDQGSAAEKVFAVLNARYHEQEAFIVSQAGVPGAITIATNMAGRGTDIQLGGNADMRIKVELADLEDGPEKDAKAKAIREQVAELKQRALAAGGLYIIGTERHESRRIDNQLRGRSGRQGDPGRSKFYLSLQDDLMRIFGSDRMEGMLTKLGLKEGEAIVHPWINRALEKAQQKVEARNFDLRKNVLKYDDVANDQRKVIFEQRIDLMSQQDLSDMVEDMRHGVIETLVHAHIPPDAYAEQWDTATLKDEIYRVLNLDLPIPEWAKEEGIADEEVIERITKTADEMMASKAARFGPDIMRQIEKAVVMQVLDHLWREHIVQLDHLRQVVGLRGYAQRDPLNEFKSEAFQLFEVLMARLREMTTQQLALVELQEPPPMPDLPPMSAHHIDPTTGIDEFAQLGAASGGTFQATAPDGGAERNPRDPSTWGKVGRNDPCPCGSGKKYKHCHGQYV